MIQSLVIHQLPSPNFWGYNSGFEAICCHGTASGDGQAGAENAEGWLRNPAAQVSSNYVVRQDGQIDCLVDPYKGYSAWANGIFNNPDTSNPLIARWIGLGTNPNVRTISIEHVAASGEMIQHQTMPPAQQAASQALIMQLCRDFHIPMDRTHIIGHFQIDSVNRANCPGVINLTSYVTQIISQVAKSISEIMVNGHTIKGEILSYWRQMFNPLVVLGFPLTEEFVDPADGRTTQIFERAVLKFYPENLGTDWPVMGQLLGRQFAPADLLAKNWQPIIGKQFTGFSNRLWNTLVVLGQPISDPFVDSDGRPAQWFERGKLKYYAEFANSDWAVQGDLLGAQYLASHPVQ